MKFKKSIIFLTIFLIFLDQITKIGIINTLYQSSKDIIFNFKFTYVENRGGAFGFGQNGTIGFIISNLIVVGIIVRFLYVQRDKIDLKSAIALVMILSGGISNLIDRIFRGFVIDFIDVTNYIKFPMFNIADICVVIGWFLFAAFTIFSNPISEKAKKGTLKIEDKSRC